MEVKQRSQQLRLCRFPFVASYRRFTVDEDSRCARRLNENIPHAVGSNVQVRQGIVDSTALKVIWKREGSRRKSHLLDRPLAVPIAAKRIALGLEALVKVDQRVLAERSRDAPICDETGIA